MKRIPTQKNIAIMDTLVVSPVGLFKTKIASGF